MSHPTPKRIGILTSGGDCAGLNAVIRAVTRRAVLGYGWEVIGIRHATNGLAASPTDTFVLDDWVHDDALLRQGGTMLGTLNKGGKVPEQAIIDGYRSLKLDALIGIGGDGSLAILRKIAKKGGLNLIGIPKTIDNDLGQTEYSVGFTTAMNVAVDALDRLQPTAESHERLMVLEVMGRDNGHIALMAGLAGGADAILIPEMRYNLDDLADHCRTIRDRGRHHALVVVAEAVKTDDGDSVLASVRGQKKRYGGIGHWLGSALESRVGWESRVTVLGHLQRGGTPSPRDRIIASAFGVRAVDLAVEGKFDRMVAWSNRKVIDVPLKTAVTGPRPVDTDGDMIHTARGLGIYVGEPPVDDGV